MPAKKFSRTLDTALVVVAVVFIGTLVLVLVPGIWAASKYKTLYKFTGGKDGSAPIAGLVFDQAGYLYGTTPDGGAYGVYGTVFELKPTGKGGWKESVLHSFNFDGKDGEDLLPSSLRR
jgi:hypothetical protein